MHKLYSSEGIRWQSMMMNICSCGDFHNYSWGNCIKRGYGTKLAKYCSSNKCCRRWPFRLQEYAFWCSQRPLLTRGKKRPEINEKIAVAPTWNHFFDVLTFGFGSFDGSFCEEPFRSLALFSVFLGRNWGFKTITLGVDEPVPLAFPPFICCRIPLPLEYCVGSSNWMWIPLVVEDFEVAWSFLSNTLNDLAEALFPPRISPSFFCSRPPKVLCKTEEMGSFVGAGILGLVQLSPQILWHSWYEIEHIISW